MNKNLKIQKLTLIILFQLCFIFSFAQYKTYDISVKGDTINAVDKKDIKQGKWVVRINSIRGEPGYEEEGVFKNDKKDGTWRRYSLNGDLIGVENYRFGGKDGLQQYFTPMGDLVREEGWRAYNPDSPYDTIPIYGKGNNEILEYKTVKAEQYSVKNGDWKFYDPSTGRLIKLEKYDRGHLIPDAPVAENTEQTKKKIEKPKEVLEFEKKNSGKKKVKLRNGQTGT